MSEWIRLHDKEWTPEQLSVEIANRSLIREDKFGPIEIIIPPFTSRMVAPQLLNSRPYNVDLYKHLKALNEIPQLEMDPIFEESPATRNPWIRSIWGHVRRQFHELVLFYVNRASRKQSRINEELICSLNELTRAIEAQHKQFQSTKSDLSEQNTQREGK